ncbi:PLD nuclease N-terminal domain-containing protein [Jonesia quinghaiensis]|uniref:PLD nuclease N-terminal domain-containing protein n=1 Tax=Jonesia quinghaiensis TaxID=262806 RepID=UPI0004271BC2|nr:PLD nuclease N-terminal domain-containing protein [Jonesia quinghaiensis]
MDFVFLLALYAGVALVIAAIISILCSPALELTSRIIWLAVVMLLPLLGPIAWFIARPKKPTNTPGNEDLTH